MDDNIEIENKTPDPISITHRDGELEITRGDIKKATFFKISDENGTAGEAVLINPTYSEGRLYVIHILTINPESRGAGLGTKLLNAVEDLVKERSEQYGGAVIDAYVRPQDLNETEKLIKFYRDRGYTREESDRSIMRKTIYLI